MKLEQEQEERSRKDESEREKRQRWEDRPFMANMMTLQMNLMCGSSNYATDQPLYPATQSGYRGPDYYSTSDVLGDVRKSINQL
jgi:hypothetical protein